MKTPKSVYLLKGITGGNTMSKKRHHSRKFLSAGGTDSFISTYVIDDEWERKVGEGYFRDFEAGIRLSDGVRVVELRFDQFFTVNKKLSYKKDLNDLNTIIEELLKFREAYTDAIEWMLETKVKDDTAS